MRNGQLYINFQSHSETEAHNHSTMERPTSGAIFVKRNEDIQMERSDVSGKFQKKYDGLSKSDVKDHHLTIEVEDVEGRTSMFRDPVSGYNFKRTEFTKLTQIWTLLCTDYARGCKARGFMKIINGKEMGIFDKNHTGQKPTLKNMKT